MAPKKKWLKFDLHMHTNRSDGLNSVKEVLTTAKRKGLDVVAITDHNVPNNFDAEKMSQKYGMFIVYGCELSFVAGHILVLGIKPEMIQIKLKEYKIKEKTSGNITTKKTIKKILRYFVDNGALVIVPHPKIPSGFMSMRGNFLADLYKEGLVHGAEIHNDDLEKKFKRKLYRIWHHMATKFVSKLEIPAYAHSDAHKKERIGNRFNMIELDDPAKLLEILRSGKFNIKHGTKSDL